ncbi:hypothetical protein [Gimesia sp.]|uniref:hypothetical protein n=1 Tax=Gimesia sp. TaxID=2024833 RepID=UPI003A948BDF
MTRAQAGTGSEMDDQEIMECLLDNDGSTRDINFTPAAFENVSLLISLLIDDYQQGVFFGPGGEQVEFESKAVCSLLGKEAGTIYGYFESETALIKKLQLFLDWPEEGQCAVELSFFSDDLQADFKIERFLSQLNSWWDILKAREVFVRYENASWEWYNPNDLGVFYHQTRA